MSETKDCREALSETCGSSGKKEKKKYGARLWAILSISMANALVGTGISPALGSMREYFSEASPILIQMIVSLPSLLVIVVAAFFPALSKRISMRGLCTAGFALFTVGGLLGGITNHIYTMIFTRVLIGLGYGLLMPLSIGLLAYFYEPSEQKRLNGEVVVWSSVSSIICMALSGYLAVISWRLVFLVYLFGIPCMLLCLKYIPKETLRSEKNKISLPLIRKILPYILGIYVTFTAYFAILNNCSSISVAEGTVSAAHIGTVMTIQTFASLITGKYIAQLKQFFGGKIRYVLWVTAIGGLLCLCVPGNFVFLCAGLMLFGIGLAIAAGILNAEACTACEKEEALSASSVVMFMRSFGQFSSPIVLSGLAAAAGSSAVRFPYIGSAVLCVLMLVYYLMLGARGKWRSDS